jgi:hypothetical protein
VGAKHAGERFGKVDNELDSLYRTLFYNFLFWRGLIMGQVFDV